jgi:hypothetical protein
MKEKWAIAATEKSHVPLQADTFPVGQPGLQFLSLPNDFFFRKVAIFVFILDTIYSLQIVYFMSGNKKDRTVVL